MPFPTPGDLPDTEIELLSLASPALAGRFFTTSLYIYKLSQSKVEDSENVGKISVEYLCQKLLTPQDPLTSLVTVLLEISTCPSPNSVFQPLQK